MNTHILGIDFGSETKKTTQAVVLNGKTIIVLRDKREEIRDLDADLRSLLDEYQPSVVAIDAPLSVPEDLRKVLRGEAPEKTKMFNRPVDALLKKKTKISMTWSMISTISFKGIYLKNIIEKEYTGMVPIEVYPGTFAGDFPDKKTENETGYCKHVVNKIKNLGFSIEGEVNSHDIADAAIAALIGLHYTDRPDGIAKAEANGDTIWYWAK